MTLLMGSILVYGTRELAYPTGGAVKEIDTEIWCQTPGVIGGAAAGSSAGALYLAKQLEELGSNVDLQPTYVQWTSTAGALLASQDDGWYLVRDLQVDYRLIGKGTVHFSCSFAFVNPGPPRRIGVYTAGGALSSTYSGAATNWVAFPLNSTVFNSSATRTGGEGSVLVTAGSAVINPFPFVPSSTIADWFKGGCRAYDAMAGIATNPVPTGGTFTHANWIEVKGPDHRFVGDVIITNGFLLLTLSPAAIPLATVYLWNTALATPGWQKGGALHLWDSANADGTLRQVSLLKVGLEEAALAVQLSTGGGLSLEATLRLQRGTYAGRLDFRPRSQANTGLYAVNWQMPNGTFKVVYNSSGVGDQILSTPVLLPPAADYGYAGAFYANSAYPLIAGLLWQNPPADQPATSGDSFGVGDTSGPALNATRSYGFFAIPFGSVSGGTTVDKLQAEAESGTLGTGWTSQAGAGGNSNGLEAKCASGTLTGNADTFGTAFVPPPQTYDVWFRVKVTSAAGAASEMKLGLYNSTDSVFVSSTTYKANQVTTGYLLYKVAAAVTPTATKNMRFRAETTATLGTDWFIDEAFLVPTTDGANSVQDLWSQFMYDRTATLKRS